MIGQPGLDDTNACDTGISGLLLAGLVLTARLSSRNDKGPGYESAAFAHDQWPIAGSGDFLHRCNVL